MSETSMQSVAPSHQTAFVAENDAVPVPTAGSSPAAEPWVADMLPALRCPVTHRPLNWVTTAHLSALNGAITTGVLHRRDGALVKEPLQAAFITSDGQFAYEVVDGIALMTPDSAILANGANPDADGELRTEKRDAQAFYDQIGWRKRSDAEFIDSAMHEDLRSHTREYLLHCNRRVKRFLPDGGKFLVDVASGPVQFDEYMEYSERFTYHVCVDLSFVALREARRKLGAKGVYILGDITNLPFKDDAIDCVVSMHTLYHVPKDEQPKAFRDIYRVTKPGNTSVVVYHTGDACKLMKLPLMRWRWSMKLGNRLAWYAQRLRQALGSPKPEAATDRPKLYFHAHSLKWWLQQPWGFTPELHCWRALHLFFMRRYVHRWLLGRPFLKAVAWLEDHCPRLMGRIGQYPMFVLRKPDQR